MAIGIGQVKISLAPRGVSWLFRVKSLFPKVRPECVHVGHVENHSPPASNPTTLFQVEDGRLRVFGAKRCEGRLLSAVQKLQPQYIPIEAHRGLHLPNPKSQGRDLFNRHCHTSRHASKFTGAPNQSTKLINLSDQETQTDICSDGFRSH